MEPHTESVAEAPAEEAGVNIEALPDAGSEDLSFEDSLEAAFANFNAEPSDSVEEPVVEEPAVEEPVEEPAAEEPAAEEPAAEEPAAEESGGEEPIEALTEDVGDDWTPKAASRFKQLKSELKSSKSELEALRQQQQINESKIKELTGLTENKDIEQLQSQVAEFEQRQMLSDLESTNAYREAITEPLSYLMEQSDQIADKYNVDPDVLVDVLALDDPEQQDEQLDELLADASDRDKAKIYRIIEEVEPIVERRQHLLENAEAALSEAKALEEQEHVQMAAEKAKLRANVTRNVVERVQQKLPFLSGLEDLDMEAIQTKAAENDPSVIHPVDHAFNAVSAQLLPNIVKAYMSMRKENELLTDRLADYETAEPAMSGQTKSSATPAGVTSEMSFEDSINAALGS